ncbi:PDZ domain-containing protein [Alienimonas californiensis]|uniref:PDZ domain-containing protein n=1 Tax=Alienimonas californiensis TaxID=2527989 RepID=A0A517PF23_9PLAN|nr:PDZ domain-containing protein [Alienimonas californiensis]QDT17973.1 hypothetical protein CA12_41110 [Alienimonas californiensis]
MFAPLLIVALAAPLAPQEGAAPADPPTPGPLRTRGVAEPPGERSDRGTLDGMPDAPGEPARQRDDRPADRPGERDRGDRRGRDGGGRIEPQLVPPDDRDSVFGVYAYNTSEGVTVTGVIPNSPAARTGLERGDRILTVDGFQVGYVRGRLYPLGQEIRRRAGRGGEVTLLVQNVRNRQLLNVDVRIGHGRPGIPRPVDPRPFPFRGTFDDMIDEAEADDPVRDLPRSRDQDE